MRHLVALSWDTGVGCNVSCIMYIEMEPLASLFPLLVRSVTSVTRTPLVTWWVYVDALISHHIRAQAPPHHCFTVKLIPSNQVTTQR